jgi:hypothetical protein
MLDLSPSERSQIAIYELQTFLIEQCIKPKEIWNGMNFDMFIAFIMNWVRLEPNLWFKSSEQCHKITNLLREKFGSGLGAAKVEG